MLPARCAVLTQLTVKNLALVDRIDLSFGPGLNVLSGETGAGKSVLIGALSLVLGGRAQSDAIRAGEKECVVEALFEVLEDTVLAERLTEAGVEVVDGEFLVRRVVKGQGRGRVLLNGQLGTVGMLSRILRGVVDVTSQHEHVSLLDPDMHLELIDAFGEHQAERAAVTAAHTEVVGYQTALQSLLMDEAEKVRREDYLRYTIDEISAVDPLPDEFESLEAERDRLKNAGTLADGVAHAEGALYSNDDAAVDAVGRVQRELERLSQLDDRLGPMSSAATELLAELEDLSRELGRYQGGLSHDPDRLDEVEDRIEQLRKLTRKHGGTIETVLKAKAEMVEELDNLEHEEARRADLGAALEEAQKQLAKVAKVLSKRRAVAAAAFEKAVSKELVDLSMEKTRFRLQLSPLERINAKGAEAAEILISPNPGEPMRALRKTASGGELSRVLLAVKHVLANKGSVETYIFDEVDTGIGGAIAEVLGAKMHEVATNTQVVCVTHLAQIAAYADSHFKVAKRETDGRTITEVSPLSEGERVSELARMLGGLEITPKTMSLAEEMRNRGRSNGSGRPAKITRSARVPERARRRKA